MNNTNALKLIGNVKWYGPGNINAINQIPKAADDKYNSLFFIDENVVTFHSPDLDYNEDLWSIDYTGYEL